MSSLVAMPVRGDLSVPGPGLVAGEGAVGRREQWRPNQGHLMHQSLVLLFEVNCTGGWAQRAPSDSQTPFIRKNCGAGLLGTSFKFTLKRTGRFERNTNKKMNGTELTEVGIAET